MLRVARLDGRRMHRLPWLVTAGLLAVALTGCGRQSPALHASQAAIGSPVSRIAVIVLENHEYDQIAGRPSAPYLNALLAQSAVAADYHAVSHPSLPNYLALTGGSTFGLDGSDCMTCSVSQRNLIDELETAGISWKAYMQDIPSVCSFQASSGGYIRRHDPFMYYRDIADNRSRCRNVVPATVLDRDLARHSLPSFVWLSPNICDDMHSCSTYTGDHYLRSIIPRLLSELGPSGILFVTWDEGSTNSGCCKVAKGGHILTLIAGPGARAGARSMVPYDHYSLLRTIEDLWKLPRLGYAACPCTHSMFDLLRVR
jgi:phosphatidylinositol-3-phosphatase